VHSFPRSGYREERSKTTSYAVRGVPVSATLQPEVWRVQPPVQPVAPWLVPLLRIGVFSLHHRVLDDEHVVVRLLIECLTSSSSSMTCSAPGTRTPDRALLAICSTWSYPTSFPGIHLKCKRGCHQEVVIDIYHFGIAVPETHVVSGILEVHQQMPHLCV